MSLIDDLKNIMQRESIPESIVTIVIIEVSKQHGGNWVYVGKKAGKKKVENGGNF